MSVFFTSRNTGFKSQLDTSSIPPWYLAVYWVSLAFSYRNPNSFLIPGGSIENGSASSIASRHLVDQSRFCSWFCWVVPRHLLDTLAVDDYFSTDVSIPLDTCICRDLLLALFKLLMRFGTHFIRYLTRYFSVFSPKLSHLTPIFIPQGFLKLFQEFLHLVSF